MFLRLTSFPIKSKTKTSDGQRFFSGCHHVIIDLYLCLHLLGLILSLIYYMYGLVLDRFGGQNWSFALNFGVISAWDPWSRIQGQILKDFGQILEPKIGPKSFRNRNVRVISAWDPWAAWATDFLIDFGSDFHEILMPKTCLKRDKKGCQTSKSFNCQLCDFVKKLRSFFNISGFRRLL